MNNLFTIYVGDCRQSLRKMTTRSVQTCITSPPYFGLRDYRVGGQLGREDTPEAFTTTLVEVFREVHRVLREDGTIWLNLGDSFRRPGTPRKDGSALKEKDLVGIPWMVAFALLADGWYLRQDIIWNKSNAMPESVTDRCTKSHEYVFLLSKRPRYYFDYAAIREPAVKGAAGSTFHKGKTAGHQLGRASTAVRVEDGLRNRRDVWTIPTAPYTEAHFATFPPALITPCVLAGCPVGGRVLDPFGGSGTTAGVAMRYSRKATMCELNPGYAALMESRASAIAGTPCTAVLK